MTTSFLSFRRITSADIIHNTNLGELYIANGSFPGIFEVNKFGRNPDIDTGTVPEDVWLGGGLYTGFPSETETIDVFSDSAADTAAGTGARTVEIFGLDENFELQNETLTLNGVTPVTSVGTYSRLFRMIVRTAGSGAANAGVLTARHTTTTANVFASVSAGINQTQIGAYTVPANHTGFILNIYVAVRGTSTAFADGELAVRDSGGVFRPIREFVARPEAPFDRTVFGGLKVEEKADIVLRIETVGANNTAVVGSFDIIVLKNTPA